MKVTESKLSRFRAEISEIDTRNIMEEVSGMKIGIIKKMYKIVRLRKKNRIKTRNEKWDFIKIREISSYETALKKICVSNLINLQHKDKFLDTTCQD